MDKYNHLSMMISQKHSILKGQKETEEEWKKRIIYSICGMMAYVSLWDYVGNEEISVTHFKRRIDNILSAYREMYPEISAALPKSNHDNDNKKEDVTKTWSDEIAQIYLNSGIVYHSSYHFAPAMYRESNMNEVCFQRGIAPDTISNVSGIGFYKINNYHSHHIKAVQQMFGLEEQSLISLWESVQASASWQRGIEFDSIATEYLKTVPPFNRGYWINAPDISEKISILRTGTAGRRLYYLYRYIDGALEVSQLPQWQTENGHYRALANACLASKYTLPPIEYRCDGELVHIHLNYLLPPRELDFLKLYSWPIRFIDFPCDFNRTCSKVVFQTIQSIFQQEGYAFEEVF